VSLGIDIEIGFIYFHILTVRNKNANMEDMFR